MPTGAHKSAQVPVTIVLKFLHFTCNYNLSQHKWSLLIITTWWGRLTPAGLWHLSRKLGWASMKIKRCSSSSFPTASGKADHPHSSLPSALCQRAFLSLGTPQTKRRPQGVSLLSETGVTPPSEWYSQSLLKGWIQSWLHNSSQGTSLVLCQKQ